MRSAGPRAIVAVVSVKKRWRVERRVRRRRQQRCRREIERHVDRNEQCMRACASPKACPHMNSCEHIRTRLVDGDRRETDVEQKKAGVQKGVREGTQAANIKLEVLGFDACSMMNAESLLTFQGMTMLQCSHSALCWPAFGCWRCHFTQFVMACLIGECRHCCAPPLHSTATMHPARLCTACTHSTHAFFAMTG